MMNTNSFPYLAMVFLQFVYGGASTIMKIGFANGLHQLVFVVYRHLLAMILFCPLAFVFERKKRPRLTFVVLMKIFILSALVSTSINVYAAGLKYTSPTLATALNCITPSFTFLVALLLRMEKVNIKSSQGQAKVLGTIITIVGLLVITFWKGGFQLKGVVNKPLIDIYNPNPNHDHVQENWVKGAALISGSKVSLSLWFIFQGLVYKAYPAPLSINVMICFFASLQSSILALFFARDANLWKLEWDVKLLTIAYGGLIGSGLAYYLISWTISKKGPVFAVMFSPLQLPIVGIFSAIAFNERLHVGSLVGAFIIIFGLYCVLWGKSKDNFIPLNKNEMDVEKNDHQTSQINVNDATTEDSNKNVS